MGILGTARLDVVVLFCLFMSAFSLLNLMYMLNFFLFEFFIINIFYVLSAFGSGAYSFEPVEAVRGIFYILIVSGLYCH